MDLRERLDDHIEATRAAQDGHQAQLWTACPGIIQSYNAEALTCTVQPAIKGRVESPDGNVASVALPLLVDVPVIFPSGGGFVLTFPVAAGDECLVVFASRCIDAWWQSGGVQEPIETRMHDLSDGFALVGPRSQARKIPAVSAEHVQLRTEDGQTYLEIQPGGKVRVSAVDVEIHASHSYSWDVDGYGQRITSKGGGSYEIKTWQQGATTTSVNLPINPPEGPGDE